MNLSIAALQVRPIGEKQKCGLRDYQTGSWMDGDPDCDHSSGRGTNVPQTKHPGADGYPAGAAHRGGDPSTCLRCGARRVDSQIGLEASPTEYVENLVQVFREVKRVLAPHGTCWVNIASSYASDLIESDEYVLREDITDKERAYVFAELSKASTLS